MEGKLNKFLDYLQHERNASSHTIGVYKRVILDFSRFLKKKNIKFEDADHLTIKSYLVRLRERGDKESSVATKFSALKSFSKFCLKRQLINGYPFDLITYPKYPKPIPRFLTEAEVKKLLDIPLAALKNPALAIKSPRLAPEDPLLVLRDKVILEVLYGTGIKVSELMEINVNDIDFKGRVILIKGKNKIERFVPLGYECKKYLSLYFNIRHLIGKNEHKDRALFLNYKGERIGVRQIQRLIKKYCKLAGLGDKISPHSLRYSFANHLINRGCNFCAVKTLLGHRSLRTTQEYAHISVKQLMETYQVVGIIMKEVIPGG